MKIREIEEVKENFDILHKKGLLQSWELPYENILTRLSAAIFFFSATESNLDAIVKEMSKYEHFSYRMNEEKKLSQMMYRVTFSAAEKEKNSAVINAATASVV